MLAVDNGTYEDVAKRAEPLTADGNAMRHSAREAKERLSADTHAADLFRAFVGHEEQVRAPHGVYRLHGQIVRMAGTDADDQDSAHEASLSDRRPSR